MSAASPPGGVPKTMSSRLLTMKFMQRAANTSPSSRAPPSPDEPSPKRQKKDSSPSTPTKFNVDALADRSAIQAALANEEAKRQAALAKQAFELGDTRWILNFEDQRASGGASPLTLRVVETGFANLDTTPVKVQYTDDITAEQPVMVGRRSFGKFNKILEKQQNPDAEDDSESDSEDDEDNDESSESESDSDDPTKELIRVSRQEAAERAKAERRAKKHVAKAQMEELAKKRRKNDVNLNGLSSLSGRQDRKVPKDVACHKCGGNHFMKDCKNNKRHNAGGDDGPPKKTLRSR